MKRDNQKPKLKLVEGRQKKTGRKSKLTPAVQKNICDAIRQGVYDYVAAQAAGIGQRTFYRWMEEGEKATSSVKRQFWQAIKRAEAERETRLLEIINDHAPKSWQAAAWILERTAGERYVRPETRIKEMEATAGKEREASEVEKMSDAELAEGLVERTIEIFRVLGNQPDALKRMESELKQVMQK